MEETFSLTKEQTEIVLSKFASEKNGLKSLMELTLNALMRSERSAYMASEGHSNGNKANGYRDLSVFGDGQVLELKIPRDRLSQFSPVLLAIYRSQEEHYKRVVFELYSKGLTTRDISGVMETIYGDNYSKSKISSISQGFYEEMERWRNRPLDSHYKAVFIDGTVVKLLRDGRYANECFYIVLGVAEDNTREILAVVNFPQESASSWKLVLQDLKRRGVEKVGLVVSDALTGIENAVAGVYAGTPHQLCCVHLMRNLMAHVKSSQKSEVSADIKEVFDIQNQSHTVEDALLRYGEFKKKWESKSKSFGDYLSHINIYPYLTYLQFDHRIRSMVYTTNWIERFNKKVKRTIKVRGALPNEDSVLALITSAAIDMGDNIYSYPIYNFNYEHSL